MSITEVMRYNRDVSQRAQKETLGNLIRETRKGAGMTVGKLADTLKVNRSAVQHWEHNRRKPSAYHALKLAEVLGLDLRELCQATRREVIEKQLHKETNMRFIFI